MGAAEQRVKSQKTAEDMKRRGIRRKTGQCPWGCGAPYSIFDQGKSLMIHLSRCQGGGARRRQRAARR